MNKEPSIFYEEQVILFSQIKKTGAEVMGPQKQAKQKNSASVFPSYLHPPAWPTPPHPQETAPPWGRAERFAPFPLFPHHLGLTVSEVNNTNTPPPLWSNEWNL